MAYGVAIGNSAISQFAVVSADKEKSMVPGLSVFVKMINFLFF
jgi:hypothetical protein